MKKTIDVAHALMRAASPLMATPGLQEPHS